MIGVSKKPSKGKLENICNRIKMKREFYQNLFHVPEADECN